MADNSDICSYGNTWHYQMNATQAVGDNDVAIYREHRFEFSHQGYAGT